MYGMRFFYYSLRARRHAELAACAKTSVAKAAHQRLAKRYADRAAGAMSLTVVDLSPSTGMEQR